MIKSNLKEIIIWPRVGMIEGDLNILNELVSTAKRRELPIPEEDIYALEKQVIRLNDILEKVKCLNN